jgi:lipoate-protein ligase A
MKLPKSTWRVIITPPAGGAWNMAVDEALLESAGLGKAPPALRLYAWEPACVSLGYSQKFSDINLENLEAQQWDVVRRSTGGRAILHTDELTYSVTAPPNEPRVAGSVLESYQRLSAALLRALELLAVPATSEKKYDLPADADPRGPVCFEVPSNYEITVEGRKLVGSAQVRKRIGVLQHGTLPLQGDLTRIIQALKFASKADQDQAAERLRMRAATVEEALGRIVSFSEAAAAFQEAFGETLNLAFTPADLTMDELARAEELVATRYGHPDWNRRI